MSDEPKVGSRGSPADVERDTSVASDVDGATGDCGADAVSSPRSRSSPVSLSSVTTVTLDSGTTTSFLAGEPVAPKTVGFAVTCEAHADVATVHPTANAIHLSVLGRVRTPKS